MARPWIGLVVLLSLGLIGYVAVRDADRTAGVAGVWVEDPDAPETRASREKGVDPSMDRPRTLDLRDLEAEHIYGPKSPRPLSLLVLLENGEAGIRPVPSRPIHRSLRPARGRETPRG